MKVCNDFLIIWSVQRHYVQMMKLSHIDWANERERTILTGQPFSGKGQLCGTAVHCIMSANSLTAVCVGMQKGPSAPEHKQGYTKATACPSESLRTLELVGNHLVLLLISTEQPREGASPVCVRECGWAPSRDHSTLRDHGPLGAWGATWETSKASLRV